ncbi:DUF1048 domain-containing protein [Lactobacillus sp. LC28-10]|uniref:DUF1048 domain-containing protein n=1 Tax=Secundilactobacillus angelensis TaxID=2722706 RepID=A0ABX1KYT4_9LACO|nr:DUF1048 domain-containing protein [Secundilactobacillus angelensis]MCH5462750.1 DUF1048 domain-containing protein [Secundilactobacillus angelensis]NLR19096.1 DUF1048 domain-containing protein [Secundilactobacillus angelensis]
MANLWNNIVGDKKRYKQFKADVQALPEAYAQTLTALQTYIWNFAKSGAMMDVLEEILHMFQESAAENVPVQQVIGDDPVEFAENIMTQYPEELWLIKYRTRLRQQVKKAEQL